MDEKLISWFIQLTAEFMKAGYPPEHVDLDIDIDAWHEYYKQGLSAKDAFEEDELNS